MQFELNLSNEIGDFKINLRRPVSQTEMVKLCIFADNILQAQCREITSVNKELEAEIIPQVGTGSSLATQKKLGEFPVDNINLGSYQPPDTGFRIKMLHIPELNKLSAIKIFREATGISILGVKEIFLGNYPCPVLTLEIARHIAEEYKKLNIFCKVVPS